MEEENLRKGGKIKKNRDRKSEKKGNNRIGRKVK
jgi:hypothetical protein